MSRSNKGIRDLVTQSRIGSEVRTTSSGSMGIGLSNTNSTNPKMAKINAGLFQSNGGAGQKKGPGSNNFGEITGSSVNTSEFMKDMDSVTRMSTVAAKLMGNTGAALSNTTQNYGGTDENFLPEINNV